MNIMAAIPRGVVPIIAAIEPASAHPQFFLCTAYIPPTREIIPTIKDNVVANLTYPQ